MIMTNTELENKIMSDRVTIQTTTFVNGNSACRSIGMRFYDDYAQGYDNTWESLPDDDMDILTMALTSDDDIFIKMMEFVQESETGVIIGENYYDWDEIKHLFVGWRE